MKKIKFSNVLTIVYAIFIAFLVIFFNYRCICITHMGDEILVTTLITIFNVFAAWFVPYVIKDSLKKE